LSQKNFPYAYDLSKKQNLSEFLSQNSKKFALGENSPYQLERNQFILAKTVEWVELPISENPKIPKTRKYRALLPELKEKAVWHALVFWSTSRHPLCIPVSREL